MQEISPSNRADFSLRKEPRHGDMSKPLVDHAGVVMWAAKQSLPTSTAAEEQRAQRRGPVYCTILREQDLQILTRGYTVAELKLDGLALLNNIADRNSAGLLICTDQVPNEKVSSLELIPMLIDDDAEMESQVCVSPACVLERFEDFLESLERGLTPKLVNQILLRLGDDESIADRTATLRDYRSN